MNPNTLRGIQTQERILANLPGTVLQVARAAGLGLDCTEKAIRRLRKEGVLVVVGTTPRPDRGGTPSNIFDEANKRPASVLMAVPKTNYRSIFVGGNPWGVAA